MRLTVRFPKFDGSFSGLKGLYLSSNRLNGKVPDVFGNNCQHLEQVNLSGNFINDGDSA